MAEIVIVDSAEDAAEIVAESVLNLISSKSDAVLGLATGSTPLPVYQELARRVISERLDVSQVRGFALDEYVGLEQNHPQSYRAVIAREVIEPLGLDPRRIHVPHGSLDKIRDAGDDYETAINMAGGIDLQLLGIGSDGHIGFNEPSSSFASLTRVKTLTEQTRRDNARFFSSIDDVPRHCITQGLGTILRSRHLVLLAFGQPKAQSVAAAVEGPLTARNPASVIQLHPHVTVIVDEAAASDLADTDYYRYVWNNKPEWQRI